MAAIATVTRRDLRQDSRDWGLLLFPTPTHPYRCEVTSMRGHFSPRMDVMND